MLDNFKNELISIWIATTGWVVRNIFSNEKSPVSFFKNCIWSWLLWLLAFWVVPNISEVKEIQYAIIYVSWLIAPQMVKILDTYIPLLIKKRIWE